MRPFLLLLVAFASAADTLTPTVGAVRIVVSPGESEPAANPFVDPVAIFASGGLAERLAGDDSDGDWLHIWTGTHFNLYERSGGQWRIHSTSVQIPAARLLGGTGAGHLVTRKAANANVIVFSGDLPSAASTALPMGPNAWHALAHPYPADLPLTAAWSGAADGDRLRLWDSANQVWVEYLRAGGAWAGPNANSASIPIGATFLYHNAGTAKSLSFARPY
jgi:hypothetical protein